MPALLARLTLLVTIAVGSAPAAAADVALDAEVLRSLLPASFHGAARSYERAENLLLGNERVSTAAANYKFGESGGGIELTIVDHGSMKIPAMPGSGTKVRSVVRSWDASDQTGTCIVVLKERISIAAKGDRVTPEDLEAATAAVDQTRVLALISTH